MKKMSWGTGIVLVIAGFFLVMGIMITIATTNSTDLVTDDYYEKELKYQDRITSLQNTAGVKDCLRVVQEGGAIVLRIAPEAASADMKGTITFYNPADKKKDFTVPIVLDSLGAQRIATSRAAKGMWKLQVSWTSRGSDYFAEQPVVIN